MPTSTSVKRGQSEKRQRRGWVCTTSPVTVDRGQACFPSYTAALHHERPAGASHEPISVENEKECVWNGKEGSHMAGNDMQNVDEGRDRIAHAPLTSEGLRQWEMHAHVDQVFDLVPFWQRGIDAAAKGEVLRLEEFLDQMEGDGGWRTADEVLKMLGGWRTSEQARDYNGWGQPDRGDWAASQRGAWEPDRLGWAGSQTGVATDRAVSDATLSSRGRDSGWGGAEAGLKMHKNHRKVGEWGIGRRVRLVGGDGREELRHFVDAIAQQEAATEERRRAMHLFSEMTLDEKMAKIQETIRVLQRPAV